MGVEIYRLEDPDPNVLLMRELRLGVEGLAEAGGGVGDGGMVAAAEGGGEGGHGSLAHLPAQVHGDLTGKCHVLPAISRREDKLPVDTKLHRERDQFGE